MEGSTQSNSLVGMTNIGIRVQVLEQDDYIMTTRPGLKIISPTTDLFVKIRYQIILNDPADIRTYLLIY